MGAFSTSIRRVGVVGLFGLLLMLTAGCGGGPIQPASTGMSSPEDPPSRRRFEPDELDQLRARATKKGTVRVIVRLNVQYTPEGKLSADGVKRQRKSIRVAQDRLLTALRGTDFRVTHRFTISPLIGLILSSDAVEALAGNSAVRHVSLDVPDRPTSSGSSAPASSPEGSTP